MSPAPSAALDHMTEQPGPGHMVMAAARTSARRRMGAGETTPHTSAGNQHATLTIQSQPAPSPPLTIFRRLPASSSFVLAAARLRALQLDPGRATRRPGTCEEDPEEQSAQPGRQDVATGPDPYPLLTPMALMGADVSESRARILIQRPAAPFVISDAVSEAWLSLASALCAGQIAETGVGRRPRTWLWGRGADRQIWRGDLRAAVARSDQRALRTR